MEERKTFVTLDFSYDKIYIGSYCDLETSVRIYEMEKWILRNKQGDPMSLAKDLNINPYLAKILINKGISTVEEGKKCLASDLANLHNPFALLDMEKSCEIIRQKVRETKRIRIIGDYDCDGICATYILWEGLKFLGAKVDYCLPHRIKDGYGLNISMVEEAARDGIDTIVTCDNGIAAIEQIAYAKELGMTVIVTDHHEVPFVEVDGIREERLPAADAIINIKQENDRYPFKGICGALTAYKLIQALVQDKVMEKKLLPFAAIATVCDVMDLVDENRIIVKEGLRLMNQEPSVGIGALIKAYELQEKEVSSYHIGFLLGPCLNATGRLDSAEFALSLLGERDETKADQLALELKEMNDTRKEMTRLGVEEAVSYMEAISIKDKKVLTVYLKDCHESLAGIIAGRLRERYKRPTLVFTEAEDGVKASGRSMDCYDMFEELTKAKHFFTKFGGHKMAAGMSMDDEAKIPLLDQYLNQHCDLQEEDFREKVYIDLALPLHMSSLSLARELERLEPFGVGNSKPLFAERELHLIKGQKLGSKGTAAKYTVKNKDGMVSEVVYFGDLEPFHQFLEQRFGAGSSQKIYLGTCEFLMHMIYQIGVNEYREKEYLQLQMKYFC